MLDFMKRYSGFFLLIVGIIGLIIMNIFEVSADTNTSKNTMVTTFEDSTTLSSNEFFFVDIKGEVGYPSVYQVKYGYRVNDIIEMAGGLTINADVTDINLSKLVYDQMIIFVPSKETIVADDLFVKEVFVDIKGAVRYPGVYKVPSEYRLYDVIMRAGGTTSLADTSQINLSSMVDDQMILLIPEKTVITPSNDSKSKIYVEVTGEVVKTGLYYVESDLLISDVINLAGGVKSTADLLSIDLSQKIVNQMIIHVPTKVTNTNPVEIPSIDISNLININEATLDQLDSLPGIGYIIAQRVIDYRAEYGPFESIEDIMKVSGIKDTIYAQIKNSICV